MKPIVTLTLNPAVDVSCETDKVKPISKVRTGRVRYDPGGGGINVARVISELGGQAFVVYLAGGSPGDLLDELVRKCGLPFHRVMIAEETRVSQNIFERFSGQEFRFVPEGPVVREPELQATLAFLDMLDFDYLVASGSLPRGVPDPFYRTVAELVHRKGARFVVDTSGSPLRSVLGHGVHLAKPSVSELGAVLGSTPRGLDELEQGARRLVDEGAAEMLAVSLGEEGAVFATRNGVTRMRPPAVEPRSAVGAGDSFVGAMVAALAQGRPSDEAFALGMAAGAATVLTPGTELCRRVDVERLYADLRDGSGTAGVIDPRAEALRTANFTPID